MVNDLTSQHTLLVSSSMLERLAHLIVRRRRIVLGIWVVLTLFGAFSAGQVSKRWYQSFSIPGYSGYETNQRDATPLRQRRAAPARRSLPEPRRRHRAEGHRDRDRQGGRGQPGLTRLLVLLDRQQGLRLGGRPHDLRRDLPGRQRQLQLHGRDHTDARRSARGDAAGRAQLPHRPAPARGGRLRRQRPERAHRGADRRRRRARHPLLRLRHAARPCSCRSPSRSPRS